jgi:hypothetical protein
MRATAAEQVPKKYFATAATFTCRYSGFPYFVYRDRLASELFNEGKLMERSPAEVADYIKTLCSELVGLANQAGLGTLAYLLGMCVDEAKSKSASPGVPPTKKGKTPLGKA